MRLHTCCRRSVSFWASVLLACLSFAGCGDSSDSDGPIGATGGPAEVAEDASSYPLTKTVDQLDTYHGVEVVDPYRWLEADVREDADVREWVNAQQAHARDYLRALPEWEGVNRRLKAVWNMESFGVPLKRGGRYFYSYNDGSMNQPQVLMHTVLNEPATVLFDPNTWSEDGTDALAAFFPDPTGRYVAYLVQQAGSDWRTAKIRNLKDGEDLSDELDWLKFTALAWRKDGQGFYYSRYPEPQGERYLEVVDSSQVYYHEIGTGQDQDQLVHQDPDHPDWRFSADVTEDGELLVITVSIGTDNRYQILTKPVGSNAPAQYLVEGFEHDYTFVARLGNELLFRTDLEAERGRVVAVDLDTRIPREVVPEDEHMLQQSAFLGGKLVNRYVADAASLVRVVDLEVQGPMAAVELKLPGIGSVAGFTGTGDDSETFYRYASFNEVPTIRRLDLDSMAQTDFKTTEVGVDLDDVVVEQVFYFSADGTRVPMFIVHKKGLEKDGRNPTLLYAYGGFNVSLMPDFSVTRAVWLERGGVFVQANLRGGGEYGENWHQAGTKLRKQNVFDDFIAAAEYLIKAGYTSPQQLGIMGGSNGGLLVGAVLNQRPELFGAALPLVGVMDMLRFHKFTAGVFWVDDYGSSDDPVEFEALFKYSPYHNIRMLEYPPVLIGTADTDDRVVPAHSFKYAARLQALQQGNAPVLLRVENKAGHGSGKPRSMRIEEYSDYWAFLIHHLKT